MASKFFSRVGTKKEMHLVVVRVASIEVPVKEEVSNIKIEWQRGDQKTETSRVYVLTPEQPKTIIDESFQKRSAFYKSSKTLKYHQKLAILTVKGQV